MKEVIDWAAVSDILPERWNLQINRGQVNIDTRYGFYNISKKESVDILIALVDRVEAARAAADAAGEALRNWKEEA